MYIRKYLNVFNIEYEFTKKMKIFGGIKKSI